MADMALRLDHFSELRPRRPLIDDQERVEATLLREVQDYLHLDHQDFSARAVEKLTDILDAQTDNILATISSPATEHLSKIGLLPSDVYQIVFGQNLINDFGWRWPLESALATKTIRSPHKQQVLGAGDGQFPALTVFGHFFQHRFPARSFWMMAIGQRSGLTLEVTQVWRAYPSQLNLAECRTLLDVVKAVANAFGHTVEVDGKSGKFFWKVPENLVNSITLHTVKDLVTVSQFHSTTSEGSVAVLVIPMNLTKYFRYVDNWKGWDSRLMQQLDDNASSRITASPHSFPE
jgi:hypothetical protein